MSRLEQAEALLVRAEDWLSDMNNPPLCVVDDIRAFLAAAPRSITLGDVLCERLGLQRSITADAQPATSAEADGLVVGCRVRVPAPADTLPPAGSIGTVTNAEPDADFAMVLVDGYEDARYYPLSQLQPADSAPPAEPSVEDKCELLRLTQDGQWGHIQRLQQQLSDLAAKVEALSDLGRERNDKLRARLRDEENMTEILHNTQQDILRQLAKAAPVAPSLLDDLDPPLPDDWPTQQVEALSKPQVEAGSTKLAEAYRDGWAEGYTEGMNMTAAMISFERTQPEFAQFEPLTVERIERIRDSCHVTYNGGHHDEPAHSAFHHGMDTALNVIASKLPPAPDAQAQEGQR